MNTEEERDIQRAYLCTNRNFLSVCDLKREREFLWANASRQGNEIETVLERLVKVIRELEKQTKAERKVNRQITLNQTKSPKFR